jgi:broad specificity phosphatase PhoE
VLAHPLVLIRHGQTDWNKRGKLQGQRDIPLNALGRDQARRNGKRLRQLLEEDQRFSGARLVSSPLSRTRETMELVLEPTGLSFSDVALVDALKEVSFGRWEGFDLDEVQRHDPEGYRTRKTDRWDSVPPEGESYSMLATRIRSWAEKLDGPTVAVAHGGVIRVMIAMTQGSTAGIFGKAPPHQDRILLFADGGHHWL